MNSHLGTSRYRESTMYPGTGASISSAEWRSGESSTAAQDQPDERQPPPTLRKVPDLLPFVNKVQVYFAFPESKVEYTGWFAYRSTGSLWGRMKQHYFAGRSPGHSASRFLDWQTKK
ncbi:hypothetical protein AB4Y43_16810 [Paraburkholderia sp. BR10872]